MDKLIKLRPHHLQCIKYFIGEGYSPSFTENMKVIIKRLNVEDNFILIDTADDLCKKCPFNHEGKCQTEEKVICFDKGIIKALDLKINQTYSYKELSNKIKNMDLLDICFNCSWHELCLNIDKKNKDK